MSLCVGRVMRDEHGETVFEELLQLLCDEVWPKTMRSPGGYVQKRISDWCKTNSLKYPGY